MLDDDKPQNPAPERPTFPEDRREKSEGEVPNIG